MNCNKCKNDMRSEDNFCSNCGEQAIKTYDVYERDYDPESENIESVQDTASDSDATVYDAFRDSETSDLETAVQEMKERLQAFKYEKVRFGIGGESAAGKSSFINLLLGLKEGDKNYAEVGVGNTTKAPKEYFHHASEQISITDTCTPGISALLTRVDFLKMVDLSKFHFFFIFFKDVLSESDAWLAEQLTAKNIPFGIVRAKIDVYVSEQEKTGRPESEAIESLRKNLTETNRKIKYFEATKLFLISNIKEYFYMGDLVKLLKTIAETLSETKAEAFLWCLPVLSPEIIELKYNSHWRRIYATSAIAAAGSALIPFFNTTIVITVLVKEIKHYAATFGLQEEHAKKVPNLKHFLFSTKGDTNNVGFLVDAFKESASSPKLNIMFILDVFSAVAPIIVSVILAPGSALLVTKILLSNLIELKDDALTVYEFYTK